MFDTFITIVVLVLLAFPVLAIVALVIAIQARDLARRQGIRLEELGRRLAYPPMAPPTQAAPTPQPTAGTALRANAAAGTAAAA